MCQYTFSGRYEDDYQSQRFPGPGKRKDQSRKMADASGACLQIQENASQAPGRASGGVEFAAATSQSRKRQQLRKNKVTTERQKSKKQTIMAFETTPENESDKRFDRSLSQRSSFWFVPAVLVLDAVAGVVRCYGDLFNHWMFFLVLMP